MFYLLIYQPWDVWKYLETFLVVTTGKGLLLAPCVERLGLWIAAKHTTMYRPAFSQQKIHLSKCQYCQF